MLCLAALGGAKALHLGGKGGQLLGGIRAGGEGEGACGVDDLKNGFSMIPPEGEQAQDQDGGDEGEDEKRQPRHGASRV